MNHPFTTRTKNKSIPAIWEEGGAYTNTGSSQIVCTADGLRKKALYVPRSGHLACGSHGLFALHAGDIVINVSGRNADHIYIWKCVDPEGAEFELLHSKKHGEWDKEPPENLEEAIYAACSKADDYHCRSLYFGEVAK